MNVRVASVVLAATLGWALGVERAEGASCESLSRFVLHEGQVTLAGNVSPGAFPPPAGRGGATAAETFASLPAFCRVAASLRPSSDSDIKIEVWLPLADWNGKLQAVGNGGWTGSIAYPAMARALARGYAATSTDTGHTGGSASFALGHPEKLVDFAYRSEHEMTVAAKAVVSAFYGTAPRYSYWNGCSAGGRQGLMEAQRFPGDYDGIIAGAPGADWTGRAAQSLRVAQALRRTETSYVPREKYAVIHRAVLEACDTLDGVQDGLLQDPTRCGFDPKVLECRGGDDQSCLTPAQVDAVRAIYGSSRQPKTGRAITGLEKGSELGWATWGGPEPLGISVDLFKYVVFKDPNWDYRTFEFDRDIAAADAGDAALVNALDPNLKPFFDRGGKLLQYHGWNDPQISPGNSVQYYKAVAGAVGGAAHLHGSYRLFMVPGMAHCGGGEGPNTFDMMAALEEWVEQGKAPDRIVASRLTEGRVDQTRPLCRYPQVARYTGSGSTDEAENFVCRD
jgi:feruloyl esterase